MGFQITRRRKFRLITKGHNGTTIKNVCTVFIRENKRRDCELIMKLSISIE